MESVKIRDQQIKTFVNLTEEIASYSILTTGINALAKTSVNIPFSKYILLHWKIKAKNHIANTCGRNSVHYEEFEKSETLSNNEFLADEVRILYAAFTAAENDFKSGLAPSISLLAQSEVFTDELAQAQELLNHNYVVAAAITASIVLESKLRFMCASRSIQLGKLDKMNSDLVKSEAYDINTQKRITAIAGIRNSAAHGNKNEFTKSDVQGIIDDIGRFLEKQID